MKQFRTLVVVKHPRDEVFAAVRDRMPELAEHLDDIESVTIETREDAPDGTTRLVNVWRAAASIPSLLQAVIKPDMLAWTDSATWRPGRWECAWTIEPHFASGASECTGVTRYEPAMGGRGTRITMDGQFSVLANRLPGVSLLIGGPTKRGIEGFVTELVPRNFQKLGKAVSTVLSQD